ncbi:hypothetical protein ACLOJK_012177 [Asimina triloba]
MLSCGKILNFLMNDLRDSSCCRGRRGGNCRERNQVKEEKKDEGRHFFSFHLAPAEAGKERVDSTAEQLSSFWPSLERAEPNRRRSCLKTQKGTDLVLGRGVIQRWSDDDHPSSEILTIHLRIHCPF